MVVWGPRQNHLRSGVASAALRNGASRLSSPHTSKYRLPGNWGPFWLSGDLGRTPSGRGWPPLRSGTALRAFRVLTHQNIGFQETGSLFWLSGDRGRTPSGRGWPPLRSGTALRAFRVLTLRNIGFQETGGLFWLSGDLGRTPSGRGWPPLRSGTALRAFRVPLRPKREARYAVQI